MSRTTGEAKKPPAIEPSAVVSLNVRLHPSGKILYDADIRVVGPSLRSKVVEDAVVVNVTGSGRYMRTTTTPLYKVMKTGDRTGLLFPFFYDVEKTVRRVAPHATFSYTFVPNKLDHIRLRCNIGLSHNQRVVCDHLARAVYSEPQVARGAGCVLVAGTGDGKTYMGGYMIGLWNVRTLVIVPRLAIMNEWLCMFRAGFRDNYGSVTPDAGPSSSNKPSSYEPSSHEPSSSKRPDPGQYCGSVKRVRDVTVITIDSLCGNNIVVPEEDMRIQQVLSKTGRSFLTTQEFISTFDAVVLDEVHNYPTEKREMVLRHTNRPIKLGLTATPDERLDGKDPLITAHIGPYVHAARLEGYHAEEVPWKCTVTRLDYRSPDYEALGRTEDANRPPEDDDTPGNRKKTQTRQQKATSIHRMYEKILADPYRNQLIIDEVRKLYDSGHFVYVFAEHRDYLVFLLHLLRDSGVADVAILYGGFDGDVKQLMERVILTTYGYAREGISKKERTAIVCATPRKSHVGQLIGRITRRDGDTTVTRRIIDVVDVNLPLRRQYPSRELAYRERKFDVEHVRVDYKAIRVEKARGYGGREDGDR